MSSRPLHSPAWCLLLLPLFLLLLIAPGARADFTLVEDFDNLDMGAIDDQDGWSASSDSSIVTLDPILDSNQVLAITTDSATLHRELIVSEGTARMLFLRFRLEDQLSCSFGMSDLTSPDRFDHFESELSVTNAPTELRINDDGTYETLTPLNEDIWYSCWIYLDNESDQTQVWMHTRDGDTALPSDKLTAEEESVFEFRNGGGNDLRTIYVKTGGGNGVAGPLYLDDIYVENTNALNLEYPYEVPAQVVGSTDVIDVQSMTSYPNPFGSSATIRFQLVDAKEVDLSVFDISGRRVTQLVQGRLPAQRHEVRWNGEDSFGRPVAAGTYVIRLRGENLSVTGRLIRMQ